MNVQIGEQLRLTIRNSLCSILKGVFQRMCPIFFVFKIHLTHVSGAYYGPSGKDKSLEGHMFRQKDTEGDKQTMRTNRCSEGQIVFFLLISTTIVLKHSQRH